MSDTTHERPNFNEYAEKFRGMIIPECFKTFRDLLEVVYDRGHLHGEMCEFARARAAIFGTEPTTSESAS